MRLLVPVDEVPYQVFGYLRDFMIKDLNECIHLGYKPKKEYLDDIEETILFIEKHDKYTKTKRVRELLKQVKTFDEYQEK